jgi:feruloyl esterase
METSALGGFAAVSTDTGHLSVPFNASWALNRPESIIDWAYRAMHESVVLGKAITEAYYGCKIAYSYYAACSTGGRQGLKEAQMFPGDFDGVLVGAPAWWTSHLQPWSLKASEKPQSESESCLSSRMYFEVTTNTSLRSVEPSCQCLSSYSIISIPHS